MQKRFVKRAYTGGFASSGRIKPQRTHVRVGDIARASIGTTLHDSVRYARAYNVIIIIPICIWQRSNSLNAWTDTHTHGRRVRAPGTVIIIIGRATVVVHNTPRTVHTHTHTHRNEYRESVYYTCIARNTRSNARGDICIVVVVVVSVLVVVVVIGAEEALWRRNRKIYVI